MLFIAIQTHTSESCPLNANEKGMECPPLWDQDNKQVKIKQLFANPPAHVMYFVLEAKSYDALQEFFMPGMTRSTVEIHPIMDALK